MMAFVIKDPTIVVRSASSSAVSSLPLVRRRSSRSRTALMLGSANLTGRGLTGPNAEAVAILDITDPALADSLYGFVNGGIDLAAVDVDTTEEKEKERAERELDDLISQFSVQSCARAPSTGPRSVRGG
jgi:hypothetical protein